MGKTILDTCLEDLERRIDPRVEDALRREWTCFAGGEWRGDLFSPRRARVAPAQVAWPEVRINASLADTDLMALQQFGACSRSFEAGDGALMAVRCNYGTGILPSVFGAELFIMPEEMNTLPTSIPVKGGIDAIKAILDRGVPDPRTGLGARVFEMAERYLALFQRFPAIGGYVHLYHPDLQGPMDVCELLWGSSLFIDVLDHPDLVHALLSLITETYIRFMREWDKLAPGGGGHAVHWSMLHAGHLMLRDDSAMNFSPAMFGEFIQPYDQRLLDAFGGGAIHFCGKGDHYIGRMSGIRGLTAINLSQPEYNDMEVIFRNTIDKGINLIACPRQAAEEALQRNRDLRHRVHCW